MKLFIFPGSLSRSFMEQVVEPADIEGKGKQHSGYNIFYFIFLQALLIKKTESMYEKEFFFSGNIPVNVHMR